MPDLLWVLASICTTLQVVIGMPAQCSLVIKNRSAADLSKTALLLQAGGFGMWAAAAASSKNLHLFIPNTLGAAFSLALLALTVVFNGNKKKEVTARS